MGLPPPNAMYSAFIRLRATPGLMNAEEDGRIVIGKCNHRGFDIAADYPAMNSKKRA